jgi:CRP/FNR family transcriptional regulator, nitrogen oxide reductase regulator
METDVRPETPVALFSGMQDGAVAEILAASRLREWVPGSILCRYGEPAVSLFLMRSGRAKFGRTTAGGDEVILRWLSPGDTFGVASLLAGPAGYMGTAETLDDSRVYEWEGDRFREAASAHPLLAQNALTIVLDYLKDFMDRHIALLSATAEQRLARTLTRLGVTSGRVRPAGVEVDITKRDLGLLADVGMYTVSRQLRDWEREGYVVKRRQRILLRHPEALRRAGRACDAEGRAPAFCIVHFALCILHSA